MRHGQSDMAIVTVDRQLLYEQVWTIPGSKLAVQYGISDVGLAKACKRYNIPRPPRGYWAKLSAGKKGRRTPLPQTEDEQYDTVYLKGWNVPEEARLHLVEQANAPTPRSTALDLSGALHPIAQRANDVLKNVEPDADNLHRTDCSLPDIRVSREQIDRATSVLSKLFRDWEARGGAVAQESDETDWAKHSVLRIGADGFQYQLIEILDDTKPVTDPTRPTGRLRIEIIADRSWEFRRRWHDTKSQRLEKLFPALVETLLQAIEVQMRQRLDAECVARQNDKIEALRSENARADSREFYSRQDLLQNAQRWREAADLREYLNALRDAYTEGDFVPSNEEGFKRWFNWAVTFADSVDPILNRSMPVEHERSPQNIPIDDIDATASTRAIIKALKINDTDQLWLVTEEQLRELCHRNVGNTWNEITRVLEIQGYDVSKRVKMSYW